VSGDGTYSFTNISSSSYTVQVTVNAGTVGQTDAGDGAAGQLGEYG